MISELPPFEGNFWSTGLQNQTQVPLMKELRCDFIVIGGGLSGLSIALHLKKMQPCSEVILVEANQIGHGASGLNSGQCGSRIGPSVEKQIRTLGNELTAKVYQYSLDAMQFVVSLIMEEKIDCELNESRQWQVSLSNKDALLLDKRARIYQSLGFNVQLLNREKVFQSLPDSKSVLNAIEFPVYMLNPYKLCMGMKHAALKAGVMIYEKTRAVSQERNNEIKLSANGFPVQYRYAIFTVDGAIAQMAQHKSSILPIAAFAAVTRPLRQEERNRIGWVNEQGIFDARPIFNFLRLTSEGRILIGGDYRFAHDGLINQPDQQSSFARLLLQLSLFFPSLKGIEFKYAWYGLLGCTLDEWPVIGPLNLSGRCWHAGGWNGHGLASSIYVGREVALALIDQHYPYSYPWTRSSARGLGHSSIARLALPLYMAWLRKRGQLIS